MRWLPATSQTCFSSPRAATRNASRSALSGISIISVHESSPWPGMSSLYVSISCWIASARVMRSVRSISWICRSTVSRFSKTALALRAELNAPALLGLDDARAEVLADLLVLRQAEDLAALDGLHAVLRSPYRTSGAMPYASASASTGCSGACPVSPENAPRRERAVGDDARRARRARCRGRASARSACPSRSAASSCPTSRRRPSTARPPRPRCRAGR